MLQVLKNRLFYHKDSIIIVLANYRHNNKTVIIVYSYGFVVDWLEMFENQEEYRDTIVVVYHEVNYNELQLHSSNIYLLSLTLESKLECFSFDIDLEVSTMEQLEVSTMEQFNIMNHCQDEIDKCSELHRCYRKVSQELKKETPNDEILRHYEDYYYERTRGVDYSLR